MLYARLVYLWRRAVSGWWRHPTVPCGWEHVPPLEADPEYLDLLIWLHDTDPAWYLRMARHLRGHEWA